MPVVSPPPDAIIWTDVCKIDVWAKHVRLPETTAEQLGEKMGLWRRRRRGSGLFAGLVNLIKRRRRRTKSNWDPKTVKFVRLCPFDMCNAMEHGANKVCWQRSEPRCSGVWCAELAGGVQMGFVSLFESSIEPANPCNFKRTTKWQKKSVQMTQDAYKKAQEKRVAAMKKEIQTCIHPPPKSNKKSNKKAIGKCGAWKLPAGHVDALKDPVNMASVKTHLVKAYAKNWPAKTLCHPNVKGSCGFKIDVTVTRVSACPGKYSFTTRLKNVGKYGMCTDDETPSGSGVFSGRRRLCQIGFMGGCKKISGPRPTTSAGPRDEFTGQCNPATGFLAISHKDGAATKRQGNKGSEVPMIWSKVQVDPPSTGKLVDDEYDNLSLENIGNGVAALGGLTGLGKGVIESIREKKNRVCSKLMQEDDALVRNGIADSRFALYKRITK